MKKMLKINLILLSLILLLSSCMSGPGEFTEMDGPFGDLYMQQIELQSKGGLAAVGIGLDKSGRLDMAMEKAVLAGRTELSRALETKVSNLQKKFIEEIGADIDSAEINETFLSVTKTLSNNTLSGATPLSKPVQRLDKKTGALEIGILVGIDPATINNSLLDEIEKKNVNLYERFRSTEAFAELTDEIEKSKDSE